MRLFADLESEQIEADVKAGARLLTVAFGGGLNSTAMLCGFVERGIVPAIITFADTGAERPETYEHVNQFSAWLVSRGMPEIVVVKNDGMYGSLEAECLARKSLPSLAYGFKSCSDKYKRRTQNKYLKSHALVSHARRAGIGIVKAVGYDAGEEYRAKSSDDSGFINWYPLISWGWDREECASVVRRHLGAKPIPKSSCFFCPAMKQHEIKQLALEHPDLMDRALRLEANAETTTVKGLARQWSWKEFLLTGGCGQFPEVTEIPCDCYDEGE